MWNNFHSGLWLACSYENKSSTKNSLEQRKYIQIYFHEDSGRWHRLTTFESYYPPEKAPLPQLTQQLLCLSFLLGILFVFVWLRVCKAREKGPARGQGSQQFWHCHGTMQMRTGVQANKESRTWETKITENKEAQRRKPGSPWCSALGMGQLFIEQCQRLRSSVKHSWKEKWDLAISQHRVNKNRNSALPRRKRSFVSTPVFLVCLDPWQSSTLGLEGKQK